MRPLILMLLICFGTGMRSLPANDAVERGRTQLERWAEFYAIDRPWESLTADQPTVDSRHRGALAVVWHRVKAGGIPRPALEHCYEDLASLLDLENQAASLIAAQPAFNDYQAHFQTDVHRLWKQLLIAPARLPERWDTGFRETYFSQALGTGIDFSVRLPPERSDDFRYPLVVVIKAGLKVKPSEVFPFIEVKPNGGGIWGYRSMSAVDAIAVIDFMKQHYPVDPERISVVGFSAGASGAMHLASCYPGEFSAVMPLVAAGSDYPIRNFHHLPVAFHHGTVDWTSAICDARVQFQRMKQIDCPVTLREYEGVGHSIPQPHQPLMTWLLAQVNPSDPKAISLTSETPSLGRTHWLKMREFQDPHRWASVEAEVSGKTMRVTPQNTQSLLLDLSPFTGPENRSEVSLIKIGTERLPIPQPHDEPVELRFEEGRWRTHLGKTEEKPMRPYEAGAAANLYEGEPLLVVYGTRRPERTRLLQAAARKLAACGGPSHALMKPPHFTVVADTELQPEQAGHCNLLLVGTPEDNAVTQSLLSKLPIEFHDGNLLAGDREPLTMQGRVASLVYPHPEHPRRLVYLVAPFATGDALQPFLETPHHFLAGSDGFDRISQPDLLVKTLEGEISRLMQFDRNWDWIAFPGIDRKVPEAYREREPLARAYLEVMKQKSGADVAFWWGPADQGMWGYDFNFLQRHDPTACTEADFRTRRRVIQTITGSVSGAEWREIQQRWGVKDELIHHSDEAGVSIDDDREYRLVLPTDLYIKLGQRKKNLKDPQPGPPISASEVMGKIFR